MKILAIGDFHGRFPSKLRKLAKKVDLLISIGDYPQWSFKKDFFKHCYKDGRELWEVLGRKKYKNGFLKDWKTAESILNILNSIKAPVVTTVGNYDHHSVNDSYDGEGKNNWLWADKDFFSETIKKYFHLKRIDYKAIKIGKVILIGAYGGSSPGNVCSNAYRKHKKKLDILFKKYRKENKAGNVIFVTHNVPYNTKLDKIRGENTHDIARGKHYGSKLVRRIIDKYKPILCVSGHMHENQGKDTIKNTVVINTGAAVEGKCAIIDFDENKGKIKSVKFVK